MKIALVYLAALVPSIVAVPHQNSGHLKIRQEGGENEGGQGNHQLQPPLPPLLPLPPELLRSTSATPRATGLATSEQAEHIIKDIANLYDLLDGFYYYVEDEVAKIPSSSSSSSSTGSRTSSRTTSTSSSTITTTTTTTSELASDPTAEPERRRWN